MWFYLLVMTVLDAGLQVDPEKLLESRCLKNANKDAWKEAEEAARHYYRCSIGTSNLPKNDNDITDAFCSTGFETCYKSLENYVNKIEPCLNLGEKYLPKFVLGCYNATVDMECRDGYLKAKISAIKSANCSGPAQMERDPLIATCVEKLEHLKRLNEPDYVLTISDFCSDIPTLKKCAVDGINTRCGNSENFIGFIARDYKAALDFCNKETSANVASKFAS